MEIDVTFDFRSDANGKDPDSHSPTLRRYHRLLWSKPLPRGAFFDLSEKYPRTYLHHRSNVGEFFLSGDSVMPTYTYWQRMKPITEQMSERENENFVMITYTIGGMMVFPSNQIDGLPTINAARGFDGKIADRFDLTVECIRRHYRGLESPLAPTLARYADFFALFDDFRGYVNFFLLQDIVTDNLEVQFSVPFDTFDASPLPGDVETYKEFRQRSIDFVKARNHRIEQLFK